MDDNVNILVEGVSKTFKVNTGGGRTLKASVLSVFKRNATRSFNALDNVSFSVGPGETLGIIGANGAGKSTLLSVIAGTMQPTSGTVATRGSVSSLLELGAGFHPDLTGRENIYLYGAIMGLSRAQMDDRFDAIVAFADLADFIDQPVKHYSSGMYVRLGFAVAVEVDPDILLIDEVLAVGDVNFQKKCLKKMNKFREQGKTMLIISHDLNTIQSISDKILLLKDGKIEGLGEPGKLVSRYKAISSKQSSGGLDREWGTGELRITDVKFLDDQEKESSVFAWGSSVKAVISYKTQMHIDSPVFGFALSDNNGRLIYGSNTQIENFSVPDIDGEGSITLCLDKLPMATGTYLFSFSVHSADHKVNYHRLDNKYPITVESMKQFEGCCYINSEWSVEE